MSETKHSPGPWRFEIDAKRDEVFGYVVTAADGKEIGTGMPTTAQKPRRMRV